MPATSMRQASCRHASGHWTRWVRSESSAEEIHDRQCQISPELKSGWPRITPMNRIKVNYSEFAFFAQFAPCFSSNACSKANVMALHFTLSCLTLCFYRLALRNVVVRFSGRAPGERARLGSLTRALIFSLCDSESKRSSFVIALARSHCLTSSPKRAGLFSFRIVLNFFRHNLIGFRTYLSTVMYRGQIASGRTPGAQAGPRMEGGSKAAVTQVKGLKRILVSGGVPRGQGIGGLRSQQRNTYH